MIRERHFRPLVCPLPAPRVRFPNCLDASELLPPAGVEHDAARGTPHDKDALTHLQGSFHIALSSARARATPRRHALNGHLAYPAAVLKFKQHHQQPGGDFFITP